MKNIDNLPTVGDLRDLLEGIDDDVKIAFSYDYGDRSHTHIVQEISNIKQKPVAFNSYVSTLALSNDEKNENIYILT